VECSNSVENCDSGSTNFQNRPHTDKQMSETQLRKVEEEIAKLKLEKEQLGTLWKVSDACKDLIQFIKDTPDPFSQEYQHENIWTTKPKKSVCAVL
jgi:hypothetical protein